MNPTWPDALFAGSLLIFVTVLLVVLLKEKRIDSENTIRFAALGVGVLIVLLVAFLPVTHDTAVSGLMALVGMLFGYVIRRSAPAQAPASSRSSSSEWSTQSGE